LDLGIGLAYHLKEVELGGISRQDQVPQFEETLLRLAARRGRGRPRCAGSRQPAVGEG